jgi:ribosome biogenesis GTP-binding protein YsxC/EngB
MASLLRAAISSVDEHKKVESQKNEQRKLRVQQHAKRQDAPVKQSQLLTAEAMNAKYRGRFRTPLTSGAIAEINGFFNSTEARLEWNSAKFLDIPGERQRMEEERQLKGKSEEELDEETDVVTVGNGPKKNVSISKSIGLPEIVFLGKANVGKSTLLNSLLTESSLSRAREFAFASKRAGFTQTMNCFNIGKRFRLIDTPGYGSRGTAGQGRQVMEYLRRRKELRRVYMLISAAEGFDQDDYAIINFLTEAGVPFEFVFTKFDRLKTAKTVEKVLSESGVMELPSEPNLIFTNSETNKRFPKRQGLSDLRASIFEACDLKPGIHPLKLIKK